MPTPTKPEALVAWDAAVAAYRTNCRDPHRQSGRDEVAACNRLHEALSAIGIRYPAAPYAVALGR